MTEVEISTIAQHVRIILDRNMVSKQLIDADDVDTLAQDDIIESAIPKAARHIESAAPAYLLTDGGTSYDLRQESITWAGGKTGIGMGDITLPLDFLRLINFQMSDWERPAQIITDEDNAYKLQSSPYSGIKGNPKRPVVAICHLSGALHLEFYSCEGGSNVTVKRSDYLPIPRVKEGKIEICPKLQEAIEYYAAYLTCISIGDANIANVLKAEAYNMADIPTVSTKQEA